MGWNWVDRCPFLCLFWGSIKRSRLLLKWMGLLCNTRSVGILIHKMMARIFKGSFEVFGMMMIVKWRSRHVLPLRDKVMGTHSVVASLRQFDFSTSDSLSSFSWQMHFPLRHWTENLFSRKPLTSRDGVSELRAELQDHLLLLLLLWRRRSNARSPINTFLP